MESVKKMKKQILNSVYEPTQIPVPPLSACIILTQCNIENAYRLEIKNKTILTPK